MWQHIFLHSPYRLAWSIKHPNGTVFSRRTFAEAVETANELSARMKEHGIDHYRCRVFKTYSKAA